MGDPNTTPDEGQEPPLLPVPQHSRGQAEHEECWNKKKARARKPISRILSRMNRGPCLDDHFSGIRVTPNLERPTRRPRPGQSLRRALASTARVFLFGLAPGDAYRASDVAIPAVGSYPAVSPLPEPRRRDGILSSWPSAVCFLWCWCRIAPPGSYPAPCPWSPDFPPGTQDAERSPSLLSRAEVV